MANPLRNGPAVQITSQFTLTASEKAKMTAAESLIATTNRKREKAQKREQAQVMLDAQVSSE